MAHRPGLGRIEVVVAATLLLVLTVGWWTAAPAGACTCMQWTDQQAFDQAHAVFVGEVTHQVPGDQVVTHVFQVDEVFKGSIGETEDVLTAQNEAACGIGFEPRTSYVVFARRGGLPGTDQDEGRLVASLCGGTRPASSGIPSFAGVRSSPPHSELQLTALMPERDKAGSQSWVWFAVPAAVLVFGSSVWWRRRASGPGTPGPDRAR
jgi:hypothetical protein